MAEKGGPPRDAAAFATGAAVSVLGGLIGLGGAEFRLPILLGAFRYPLIVAVVINLIVSLVTVSVSLAGRASTQGYELVLSQWHVAATMLVGALFGSHIGVTFASRVSERAMHMAVAVLLALLGLLLVLHEWLIPAGALPLAPTAVYLAAMIAGVPIGVVSSLLGVAGGEMIIPALVLLFGMDIKVAGSAGLLISIPTILFGLFRYRSHPVYGQVRVERRVIYLMASGSVLGAWLGSKLLPYAPSMVLRVLLGIILLISAARIARAHGNRQSAPMT